MLVVDVGPIVYFLRGDEVGCLNVWLGDNLIVLTEDLDADGCCLGVEAIFPIEKIGERQAGHVTVGVIVDGDFAGVLGIQNLLELIDFGGLGWLVDDF